MTAIAQGTEPSSEAKLRFLCSPAARDGGEADVELIETHMSWLVLDERRVLKMKKPVRHAFLDFSTLAAREANCREELRLNRRLAATVYEGLRVLVQRDGRLMVMPERERRAEDRLLEWLVAMRRLPSQRMADRLLSGGLAEETSIDALAERLAAFYREATASPISADDYLAQFVREQRINREVLLQPRFESAAAGSALERLDQALITHADTLRERVRGGHVVDGHGDLRPEHVCLIDPPVVIDALEFNAALRQVDPIDELAFFALECTMLGAGWAGQRVLSRCCAASGPVPAGLIDLYTAYRALLRARIGLAHLLEPVPRTPARWMPLAARYVEQATTALDALDRFTAAAASPSAAPR